MRTTIMAIGLASIPLLAAAQERPKTAVHEVTDVMHGTTLVDPYRWLEDQDSPDTRVWIDRQNAHTRAALDPLPGRTELKARLSDFIRTAEMGWPIPRGERYFYQRRGASEQMPSFYVRHGLAGQERLLLDPARFSPDFTKSFSVFDVDPSGTLVAYGYARAAKTRPTSACSTSRPERTCRITCPRARTTRWFCCRIGRACSTRCARRRAPASTSTGWAPIPYRMCCSSETATRTTS